MTTMPTAVMLHHLMLGAKNQQGSDALHLACLWPSRAPALILTMSPHTVKAPNWRGRLPLHFACIGGNVELVRLLLTLYPSGARRRSENNEIPLHSARSRDIIVELLRVWPDGAWQSDLNGSLPLHRVAADASRPPSDVAAVQALIDAYPEGVETLNLLGRSPLEEAMLHRPTSDPVVCLLLSLHEGAEVPSTCQVGACMSESSFQPSELPEATD